MKSLTHSASRRRFLGSTTKTAAISTFGILGCSKTYAETTVGDGDHRYEVIHNCVELPDKFSWQTTHNVAVDKDQNLYVIHEGKESQKDHPAIFVFDADGKFVKAFGQQFQGGGHGLEVRTEGNEQFIYVTGYHFLKTIAKLTMEGEEVWSHKAPMDSGAYAADENTKTDFKNRGEYWGRNHFLPTNFAFLPDGSFFVADGYGAFKIHRYDKDANYVSSFGKPGKGDGEFNTPHGLWIDTRSEESQVVVADRANGRLQWFSLEGEHRKTLGGFILPANIDQYKDTLLVPDLSARITILDKDNNLIHLGESAEWRQEVMKGGKKMRSADPKTWTDGKFIHPHDACFAANGDIFVAEWVATGRISKLRRVG